MADRAERGVRAGRPLTPAGQALSLPFTGSGHAPQGDATCERGDGSGRGDFDRRPARGRAGGAGTPSAFHISPSAFPMVLTEETISTEPVYDGVLLHVRRDEVRLPSGSTSVREWIEHPGASAVVPIDAQGRVVLVRQFRYPPRREFLEVPAGKFDAAGEAPLDVARRELEEETGCTAAAWTALGRTFPGIGYSDEVIHLFLAEGLTDGEAGSDDDEFVEVVRLPFDEAVRRAEAGEILDAKTALALLMARAALARR